MIANEIPTGILRDAHIDTSSISEDRKREIISGCFPGEWHEKKFEKTAKLSEEEAKKMAMLARMTPGLASTLDSDEMKGIRESSGSSWQEVVENNKQSRIKEDWILSKGAFGKSHYVENKSEKEITPKDLENFVAERKNFILNQMLGSQDAHLSESSRQDIRQKIRTKEDERTAKREEQLKVSSTHAGDVDPISGLRKGIKNISERTNPLPSTDLNSIRPQIRHSQEELNQKAELIAAACSILSDRNNDKVQQMKDSHKDDWVEDSMSKLSTRLEEASSSLKRQQKDDRRKIEASKNVSPENVTEAFQEFFSSKNTHLGKVSEDIRKYNQDRSAEIKEERVIETSLDHPSLPTTSASRSQSILDGWFEKLSSEQKKKYIRDAKLLSESKKK